LDNIKWLVYIFISKRKHFFVNYIYLVKSKWSWICIYKEPCIDFSPILIVDLFGVKLDFMKVFNWYFSPIQIHLKLFFFICLIILSKMLSFYQWICVFSGWNTGCVAPLRGNRFPEKLIPFRGNSHPFIFSNPSSK